MQNQNKFRISDNILFTYNIDDINYTELKKFIGSKQFVTDNLDNTVITDSVPEFVTDPGYLNKIFSTLHIINETELVSTKFINASFKLQSAFNWDNVFGILVIIYNVSTSEYIIAEVLTSNMFKVTGDLELFQNDYWNVEYTCKLPRLDENCIVYTDIINYDDVSDATGYLFTYPKNLNRFSPLINNDVLPSTILTSVNINENNNFIEIEPYTTVTDKTLERVLLEFFGFDDKIIPIEVNHTIKYGVGEDSRQLNISNVIDKYGKISIGLDLSDFYGKDVTIFVNTEYTINSNLKVNRNQTLIFSYVDILEPSLAKIVKPVDGELVMIQVDVVEEKIIEQQIFNTPQTTKVNTIYQNVLVEIVNSDFTWDNKNIVFESLEFNVDYYMVYDSKTIFSKRSINGQSYFNLINAIKPRKITEFKIYNLKTTELSLTGLINI